MKIHDDLGRVKSELSRKLIRDIQAYTLNDEIVLDDGKNRAKGSPSEIRHALAEATDSRSVWEACERASLLWPRSD